MATSLENQYISSSFDVVVQLSGSQLADGTGATISSLDITASNATQAVSASFATTASYALYAVSASYEIIEEVSSSYAQTASYADYAVSALSSSHSEEADHALLADSANNATSSSYALSASLASAAIFATTASYALNVPTVDTGSLLLTGSISDATITLTKADASSFNLVVNNVANATSASHAVNADNSISSSYSVSALSSSYSNTSTSASHALSADTSISSSHALVADSVTGTVTNATYAQNTIVTGKNITGSPIAKGTPLYFTDSGTSGNLVGIQPADAGNAALMPAGGIAGEAIAAGAEGIVLLDGFINNVDTSLFAAGDEVFVAVGGGYTNSAPTGSALVQKLGNVEKSAINGSGVINGPGAVRSVPNITNGSTWVGNASGVATPTAVSSLSVASAISSSYATSASYASTSQVSNTIKIYPDGSTSTRYLTYVDAYLSGDVLLRAEDALQYNPGTNTLTATNFAGALTGNASSATSASYASTAASSDTIDVSSENSSGVFYPTFVDANGSSRTLKQNDGLRYDPFTNSLVANTFSGDLTGNVTGTATTASFVSEAVVAKTDKNNTFTGTQTFNNIQVNGTGSFAYIQSVTGSAKIVGDAFIILNNDTPVQNFAGLKVQDSGSNTTASLQFDGANNNWFYEYDGGDHNFGVVQFGPEYSDINSPAYNTANTLVKSNGNHHLEDSNISDSGTLISLNSNSEITGSLGVSGIITAPQLVITGGAGTDVQVTGTLQTTQGIFPIGGVLTGDVGGLRTFAGDYGFYNGSGSNDDAIGMTIDNVGYGNSGWDGPAIWGNDPGDNYPAFIGFQNKTTWTDGRVTVLTPLSASAGITGDLTGSLEASVIEVGQEFGDGINFYQNGLSQLRFYSGSNKTEVGTWVNMQVNPANGALAISSFPDNNHFVDFNPYTTSSIFTAPVVANAGITGDLTGNADTATALTSGDKTISGTLTATKLVLTGGAGNDLIATGSALFTSTISSNVGMQAGTVITSYLNNQFIGQVTNATGDEIGITSDPSGYGVSGWTTGPALYLNDPGDTYPVVIGFQNKASWTDGRVTFLTPIAANAGVIGDLTGNADTATSASYASNASTADNAPIINDITYPTVDGSAGQAIVTDGDGNLSFADVAGSPEGATSTGTTLAFDNAIGTVYNTAASPATGNLTLSTTSAVVGASAVIYHEDSAEPTVSGMTVDKKIGTYDTSALNVITFIHVGSNHVIQTIAGADTADIASTSGANTFDNTNTFDGAVLGGVTTLGTSGTVSVDLSTKNFFSVTPSGTITLAVTGADAADGQTISIVIDNSASQTVSFTGVLWPAGTAPTITAGGIDIVTLITTGGSVYGTAVQNFS